MQLILGMNEDLSSMGCLSPVDIELNQDYNQDDEDNNNIFRYRLD